MWKFDCPNFLFISYFFFFFFSHSHFRFPLWFFLFHFFVFPSFFAPKQSQIMDERKKKTSCCNGYVLVFFYVDSTNVEHSSLGLRYEMEKYPLFVFMCEFMCKKKLIIWAFKRQHKFTDWFLLDSYIKKMLSKVLQFIIIHFDTFAKNWVHIWKNNIYLWEI